MHRGSAAVAASLAGGKERVVDPKPLLIAAVSTLPSRAGEPLRHSLSSMYGQIRPPDAVILSTPQQYKRGDLSVRPVAARPPPPHALLWQVSPQTDSGPGTKALGALSTARALAREQWRVWASKSCRAGARGARAQAILAQVSLASNLLFRRAGSRRNWRPARRAHGDEPGGPPAGGDSFETPQD